MRISNKTLSLLSASLFVVGLSAGLSAGCGSSSSSTDLAGICNRTCAMEVTCQPDGGTGGITLDQSFCTGFCAQHANTASCSNAAAVSSAWQACLNKSDCTAFSACIDTAPECTTTTATGGSSGTHTGGSTGTGTGGAGGHATGGTPGATGGTTGAAGNGGTADCASCTKGNSCCMAVATMFGSSPSQCTLSASDCSASADPASYASGCQQALSTGAALNIAACK